MWRKAHRDELLAAGLPSAIVDDERSWNYVLLHGDDYLQSGWNLTWINKEQAKTILAILRSQTFWNGSAYWIFEALEAKIAAKSDSRQDMSAIQKAQTNRE